VDLARDLGQREVRRQERVGELARDDRLRHDLTLGCHRGRSLLGDDDELFRSELETGRHLQVALERLGGLGHDGVLREQRDERGVAGGRLGEDLRDAVEALHLLRALGVRDGLVDLDAGSLLAHQQGDDLELGARRGLHLPSLSRRLDLAHGAGQHGDQPVVVDLASTVRACGGTGAARLTLAWSSQGSSSWSTRRSTVHMPP
jgi:hypothetical protein